MRNMEMSLSERAAYIKGLAEGLDLDADKKEVRVIKELLELVGEMAGDLEAVGEDLGDLYEVVDELDESFHYVEEELFGHGGGEDFGDEMYELSCPHCQEIVHVDEELLLGGDVICPACGERIEIELDGCDCEDCGHHHHD